MSGQREAQAAAIQTMHDMNEKRDTVMGQLAAGFNDLILDAYRFNLSPRGVSPEGSYREAMSTAERLAEQLVEAAREELTDIYLGERRQGVTL